MKGGRTLACQEAFVKRAGSSQVGIANCPLLQHRCRGRGSVSIDSITGRIKPVSRQAIRQRPKFAGHPTCHSGHRLI